jgi:hypothetical protein
MKKSTIFVALIAAMAASTVTLSIPAANAAKGGFGYGCFVANKAMNIRAKPWAESASLVTAKAGDTFVKRKRFCNFRGYWCAVTTMKGVEGYGDKSLMTAVDCK